MTPFGYRRSWTIGIAALAALAGTSWVTADPLSAVQTLRLGGCGGIVPASAPLRHSSALDHAAAQWAAGESLAGAAERNGYAGGSVSGVQVDAPDSGVLEFLRRSQCRALTDPALREIGVYRRGSAAWLVLAGGTGGGRSTPSPSATVPAAPPARPAPTPPVGLLSVRALELVNEARARGARCGTRQFAPVQPLTLSGTLVNVAYGHASDMAVHNYFEHQDLSGHSPADRVRAIGYKEKLVGENIAYGPQSVEEVVKGWLDSPGHCENIMDGRFLEMGIAYATGSSERRGPYWVQVLAEPRA